MGNTKIQIKRSTSNSQPSGGSLLSAEPAYSYVSNTAFIGTSDGTGVLPIGGYFYVLLANSANIAAGAAFDKANSANIVASAAFDTANSAGGGSSAAAFDKANSANIVAGAAFDKANSANVLAYNTGTGANAFTSATIAGANTIAIAAFTAANAGSSTSTTDSTTVTFLLMGA